MSALTAVPVGAPAEIDPFAPAADGVWHGTGVTVRRVAEPLPGGRRLRAQRRDGRLIVEHHMCAADLCDDLAEVIVAEIGSLEVQADFEEVFTGIVRSAVPGPLEAWLTFYANSLRRLEIGAAGFSPVHRYAAGLIRGTRVVDLGSCFGFFPLRLTARGIDVLATDLSAPTMGLLARMGALLGRPVRTLACDAVRVPLPDGCASTVTALHLLEHLAPDDCDAVLDESLRLARRRVIVAVPFEAEATACYGHVQRFGRAELDELAWRLRDRHPHLMVAVSEHHGGWLVADR